MQGLRAFLLNPPPERMWPELQRLAGNFAGEAPQGPTGEGFHQACAEAALALYSLADAALGRTEPDTGLALTCLRSLPRMGPLGRVLTIALVERDVLPFDDVASILAELPELERRLLFNRLLLSPWRQSRDMRDFALDVLTMLKDGNPVDGAKLLKHLSGMTPRPAFAVREALLDGSLGQHLLRLAAADSLSHELLDMAPHLSALESQTLAERLARLADKADSTSDAARILDAVAGLGPQPGKELSRALAQLLSRDDHGVILPALEALLRLGMQGIGRVMGTLYAKRPTLKKALVARLPLLPSRELRAFLEAVPPRERTAVFLLCFLLLGRVDPTNMERCLSAVVGGDPVGGPMNELLGHVAQTAHRAPEEPEGHAPSMVLDAPSPGKGKKAAPAPNRGPKSFNLKKDSPSRFSAKGLHVIDSSFEETSFFMADFTQATLERCAFSGCRFSHCVLDLAVIKDSVFTGCSFEHCSLRSARFFRTGLTDCVLTGCVLVQCGLKDCALTALDIGPGVMSGAVLSGGALLTCRFRGLDLSGTDWNRLRCEGLEFDDCIFAHARLAAMTVRSARLAACTFEACAAEGLDSDDPTLGELADHTLLVRLREAAPDLENGRLPGNLGKDALRLAAQAVDEWFRVAERKKMCRPFIANNERRLSWGKAKMGRAASEFFDLVPLLLHTDFFDHETGLYPVAPPCRLAAYQPTYSALEAARKYYPSAALPQPHAEAVPIEAIYTIGSLGTIAQSEDSDIDYWLCCKLDELAEQDIEGLQQKCELIQEWADQEFGLEVYFFLMDEKSVRDNKFGASGGESSGTAQALMLKEEFYRTAVYVAGKKPLWWLVGPGAGQGDYDAAMRRLVAGDAADRFIDLGHVPQIPREEFFGASLWQIVKAIKSPFKSIMKFGLLEKYISQTEMGGFLLCDRVKANILAGLQELWHIDPYVLLFLEVAEFYASRGDKETVELIRMSFFLKAKITREAAGVAVPSRPEEKSIRMLFAKSMGEEALARKDPGVADEWNLARIIDVGAKVNQFVLNTYLRVRDQQKGDAKVAIDPRDMTKLGRKIFSVFAPRKYKIDRLSFVKMDKKVLNQIAFSAVKPKKGDAYVQIQGGQFDTRTRLMEMLELKRSPDLCWLVAWIEANKIWFPELTIKTDFTVSPVIVKDIEELIKALGDFFPHHETFETDISESLNPERVLRAFFVLNLTMPRETAAIRQASLIYSTNWGEMFCQTVAVNDETIITDPHGFLARHVEQDCSRAPLMGSFTPDRAACPGIRLAKPGIPGNGAPGETPPGDDVAASA